MLRRVTVALAASAFALTGALAVPAAAQDTAPKHEQEKLIGRLGPGGGGLRLLDARTAEKTAHTPSVSLRQVADAQRKATLDLVEHPEKAPPKPKNTAEAQAPGYDYYGWDECRRNEPDAGKEIKVVHKNHFASCTVVRSTYTFYGQETGEWQGEYTFRFTVLGKGSRASQTMTYDGEFDDWKAFGKVDPSGLLDVRMGCVNLINASCDTQTGGGGRKTIAEWQTPLGAGMFSTFDTTRSTGGGDIIHFNQDRVNYHQMRLTLTGEDNRQLRSDQNFRCDAAAYFSTIPGGSVGACLYHEIPATLHYQAAKYPKIAEHIKNAQDNPANTNPNYGDEGARIPGARKSGKPLTRLVPSMNAATNYYYEANRREKDKTCANGRDPDFGTPDWQCDEYPFASTWEGAYYTVLFPGSYWKYSAKLVPAKQNSDAGTDLGAWYGDDHILCNDKFWVQIDP